MTDLPEETGAAPAAAPSPARWRGPSTRRWALFAILAVAVVLLDRITKGWVLAALPNVGDRMSVVGDYVRIVHWRNTGALFGLLPDTAPVFAIVSFAVAGLIVWYHRTAGRGILVTVALGLLLGGAIGNLIDRLFLKSVVDFVDVGVGTLRFYTFNIADAGISTAIVLLLGMALVPRLGEVGAE